MVEELNAPFVKLVELVRRLTCRQSRTLPDEPRLSLSPEAEQYM